MTESEKQFFRGYVCCLTGIVRGHGYNTPEIEAMQAGGINRTNMKIAGCDDYDFDVLSDALDELQRKEARQKDTP